MRLSTRRSKLLAPVRALPEIKPLFAAYIAVVAANFCLALCSLAVMLTSLSSSPCLGTAAYAVGAPRATRRRSSLGARVASPLQAPSTKGLAKGGLDASPRASPCPRGSYGEDSCCSRGSVVSVQL